ncbi:methyl-accepting chemotaxis protein [Celerinatantimonas sp. YJH-8]|uniref:methyl-accepting chemotaxis protein n=1 Tax=Celerinatantimonas sp. YJH-8 TaxID=3228714 RepID=UPI0038C961D5
MNFFFNLGIRWKLTLPLVVVIILVLILAGRSLYSENLQAKAISTVTTDEIPSLNLVQQADRDFHQALVAERSMLMLRVGSEQYQLMQKMHQENILQVEERIKKMASYTQADEIRQLLDQFWKVYPQWREMTERIAKERDSDTRQGRSSAIGLSYKEGEQLFNESRGYLDQISDIIIAHANQRSEQLAELHQNYRYGQLILLGISLVVCLWVLIFFPSLITKDLGQIIQRVKILAQGGGDLTQRIAISRKDELGQLGHYLDQFIIQLNALVKEVIDSVQRSDDEVKSLDRMSHQTRLSLQKQTDSVREVNHASREMNEAIQAVSESTSEAALAAEHAHDNATKGQGQVETTRNNIETLNSSVVEAVNAISRIEEVTTQIGSVLTVISGIAEQTNLLALNAAIEAARAGESGRGFAVVADEVRALAGKTQLSTDDVKEMISNLNQSVQAAVSTMKEASDRALLTRDSSEETKQAIDAMMVSIIQMTELATHIAEVTNEQRQSAESVQNHITEIEGIAQNSADQAAQVDQSCTKLAELHRQLNLITDKFTV